jgi:hypothetical protein
VGADEEREEVERRGGLVAELSVPWRCILKVLPLDPVVENVAIEARRDSSLARYCCCACCRDSDTDG